MLCIVQHVTHAEMLSFRDTLPWQRMLIFLNFELLFDYSAHFQRALFDAWGLGTNSVSEV